MGIGQGHLEVTQALGDEMQEGILADLLLPFHLSRRDHDAC